MTDASDTAVGAVLQQHINGIWRPISFFSRKMTPAETRYSTCRELLAVYLAIKHFRQILEGRPLHVLTDHKPLTSALNTRSDRYSPRQARHLYYISQFTSTIRHVQGMDNVVADIDALSRIETNALCRVNLLRLTSLQLQKLKQPIHRYALSSPLQHPLM